MADDHDAELPANLAMYHGSVVANDDPLKLGRVRFRIPAIVEPRSDWAFPLATGGGGDGVGFFSVPKVGAEVAVWFKGGDEEQPFYAPAHWPQSVSMPSAVAAADVTPQEAPDVHTWETDDWAITMDDRAGRETLTIKDKQLGNDFIEIDGVTKGVTIQGTVAIRIIATGAVQIDGATVTIKGRPVLPSGKPI
jgi:uncharacterized protein involved in type VI secretion and phage assembly